ncbi:MAG: hypothetical protein MRY57_01655 [Candidatus Pacebacteria bacterium]|nr:hypothetical protein [Candidatus Paceibacterota bacterium]
MSENSILSIYIISFILLASPLIMVTIRSYQRKKKRKRFEQAPPFLSLKEGNFIFEGIEHDDRGDNPRVSISYPEKPDKKFLFRLPQDPEIRKKMNITK